MGRLQLILLSTWGLSLWGRPMPLAMAQPLTAPEAMVQYEQAVRFQLSRDAQELVEDHFRSLHAPGAKDARIHVEPRLIEVAGEPWLAGVRVSVQIPPGKIDASSLKNLLVASYSAQGFDVRGTASDAPQAHIDVSYFAVPAEDAESFPLPFIDHPIDPAQVACLIAFVIMSIAIFVVVRARRHARRLTQEKVAKPLPETLLNFRGTWDLRALLDAPTTEVRDLFQSLPIHEAIQILSQLDPPARRKVFDELRIQLAVRKRIEERLSKIYAKGY